MSEQVKQIDDGGAAFPRPCSVNPTNGTLPDGDSVLDEQDGMSLRDYFAGLAMQGILAGDSANDLAANEVAADAYLIATRMLAARKAVQP